MFLDKKNKNRKDFIEPGYIKDRAGFTLLEILLAISIFMILSTAVLGIYVAFSKMQTRTLVAQQVINDSQFALEVMAREIRNGEILLFNPSTDDCNDIMSPSKRAYEKCIILKRDDGSLISFGNDPLTNSLFYQVPDCNSDYSICQETKNDPQASLALLQPILNNVSVDQIDFIAVPSSDPFAEGATENIQPRITIRMKVYYDSFFSGVQVDNISYTFQTTVATRIYKR